MISTQRVWYQPASIVVHESELRARFGIGDDERLEDLDPQELADLIGEALLHAPDWRVEPEEDYREDQAPYEPSPYCRCGHWLEGQAYGSGHPPPRPWRDDPIRPCRSCGCQQPEHQPDPPWVRQAGRTTCSTPTAMAAVAASLALR